MTQLHLAYLKCYFQMTFNTVTPPALALLLLHIRLDFCIFKTRAEYRDQLCTDASCSTNKKICIRHLWYRLQQKYNVRCIWHIWPFKFCGYYYLNRFSIRHANPINPTLFERLVITIFALTGATPKKTPLYATFFVPFKRFTGFLSYPPDTICTLKARFARATHFKSSFRRFLISIQILA